MVPMILAPSNFISMSGNIFLVGLMGAGKTTIGRALAKKLNRPFYDSDQEIEARTGATIPTIFEIEGEESFRKREADMIRELSAIENAIIATGGGAAVRAETRACMKEFGTVIYLQAGVSQLLQRTSRDRNRPLLQTSNPRQRLEDLLRQRDPFYREVADMLIETGRGNISSIVNVIIQKIERIAAPEAISSPTAPHDHSSMPE